MNRPWRRAAGVAGPVAFATTWAALGASQAGYSPLQDPISRLAATDAPSRWLMTAGFIAFSAGVGLYSPDLRATLPGRAAFAATTSAVATVGIAATPLGSVGGGTGHAACAAVAYASLAATPLFGAQALARQDRRQLAWVSRIAGVVTAAALLGSVVSPSGRGLFQRIGLSVGDAWIIASAFSRRPAKPELSSTGSPAPSVPTRARRLPHR